jgi:hypothetical protein
MVRIFGNRNKCIPQTEVKNLSGGEQTRLKLAGI